MSPVTPPSRRARAIKSLCGSVASSGRGVAKGVTAVVGGLVVRGEGVEPVGSLSEQALARARIRTRHKKAAKRLVVWLLLQKN